MEEFKVTIDQFEGPLDLMLHLIKEKELDLFDLDVNVLTDQYIAYLNAMSDMHLEVTSEYLVELATLIEYKSKRLLPKDQSELEDDYEEDPKERLVKRLLEYQQYKEVSHTLYDMYEERQDMFSKAVSSEVDEYSKDTNEEAYEGNPYDLMKAMRKVMMRMQLARPIETRYTHKEISMEERQLQLRSKLMSLPETFTFENLLDDVKDVPMFIATFLAVLDMARRHSIVFTVDENETIWFSKGTGMPDGQ